MRIIRGGKLQVVHDLGGDPAGTKLQARKARFVQHHDLAAVRHELAGASTACWSAADDDGFDVTHRRDKSVTAVLS